MIFVSTEILIIVSRFAVFIPAWDIILYFTEASRNGTNKMDLSLVFVVNGFHFAAVKLYLALSLKRILIRRGNKAEVWDIVVCILSYVEWKVPL